jgi:hypothetical protein
VKFLTNEHDNYPYLYTSVSGLDRDRDRNPDPGRPKQFPKEEKIKNFPI